MYLCENVHVKFQHCVFPDDEDCRGVTCANVSLVDADGAEVMTVERVATCAKGDNYSKKIGRKIALSRALLELFPEDKDLRSRLWEAFKVKCKVV